MAALSGRRVAFHVKTISRARSAFERYGAARHKAPFENAQILSSFSYVGVHREASAGQTASKPENIEPRAPPAMDHHRVAYERAGCRTAGVMRMR